ncbi:hypothetical protein C8P69_105374 [Phreatobacter oligotrophus]|uniref:Uncharacterized protein n=1 Tax=Phreatobacter oligotrophus TaxID=1122261 RepID=A0A2T4Z376_9HYPH|nr:hypothetical protein C8P69_105374 [Phreatobacter oligotrophus]
MMTVVVRVVVMRVIVMAVVMMAVIMRMAVPRRAGRGRVLIRCRGKVRCCGQVGRSRVS